MVSFFEVALYSIIMTIILSIVVYAFWSWRTDVARDSVLRSTGAYINADDRTLHCDRLEYRGTNTHGEHLLTCIGAAYK